MVVFDYKNHILLYSDSGKDHDHITVGMYEDWAGERKQDEIADLIVDRLIRRYIKPFDFDNAEYKKAYKNGFAMMASYCLLIETLEGFYRGWEKSKNGLSFVKFFSRDSKFSEFATNDLPTIFYRNIRCGILHQGETSGGWLITRKSDTPLLARNPYCINATRFGKLLESSLIEYRQLLKSSSWDDELWRNARNRMKAVISNCKSPP